VRNIFPGGTVANLSLSKPFMNKMVGADINAVDAVEGSELCPDEMAGPGEPVITAEAKVNFHIEDEDGNDILTLEDYPVTCVAGIDDGVKVIVTFGPENCGPGGNNAGTFKIFTTVSGEAGFKERTQRIKCRQRLRRDR
jgi:hypothetical protein